MPFCKLRPRGLARRQAMLQAATELFLSQGYENTSLSDILERSKGSRSTFYGQFGSKEGLFKAVIEHSLENVSRALDGEETISELNEDGLADLGMGFMRRLIEPLSLGVFRLIVEMGHRLPEVSEYVERRFRREIQERLSDIFRRRLPAACGDPEAAGELATFFLWAVAGDIHFRYALDVPPVLDDAETERLVRGRVRLFLWGAQGLKTAGSGAI